MKIVISGTVGIGKSTTSQALVDRLQSKGLKVDHLREETVDSVYLKYYYEKPEQWAFISQMDWLLNRFKQWLENYEAGILDPELITVYDRHFLDDYVFAELHSIKQNISMYNSLTYQGVYKEILDKMARLDAQPDYFIMLKAPLDVVIERFESRSRAEEVDVDYEYWKDLYQNYYDRPMFQNHFKTNVKNFVEIDTTNKTTDQIVDDILQIIGK